MKILVLDIETAPILAHVWGLFDQNIGLNQIEQDWHLLSFSAKWLGEKKITYMDQRNVKNIEDDTKLLKALWKLIDEADVVLGQNSKAFDVKKLNARFILNGFPPPSSFRHIDTFLIAKKHFAFTSHKLEWMTKHLCTKHKKISHAKFSGFELWRQCIAGNKKAWKQMEVYNKADVLSTEELYHKLKPWDNSSNINTYHEDLTTVCTCGGEDWLKNGFAYTNLGKFQRYKCSDCNSEIRSRVNLLSKEKKASLKAGTSR